MQVKKPESNGLPFSPRGQTGNPLLFPNVLYRRLQEHEIQLRWYQDRRLVCRNSRGPRAGSQKGQPLPPMYVNNSWVTHTVSRPKPKLSVVGRMFHLKEG